jgi:hypothetical protein
MVVGWNLRRKSCFFDAVRMDMESRPALASPNIRRQHQALGQFSLEFLELTGWTNKRGLPPAPSRRGLWQDNERFIQGRGRDFSGSAGSPTITTLFVTKCAMEC